MSKICEQRNRLLSDLDSVTTTLIETSKMRHKVVFPAEYDMVAFDWL